MARPRCCRPDGLDATSAVLLNALGQGGQHLTPHPASTPLNLHGLAAGVYTLRLTTASGTVVRRLVVE